MNKIESGFQKGHPSYTTPESIKKVKISLKKFWTEGKRKEARSRALQKGYGKWMIGKKHSSETIKKMKGRKCWNKGKKTPLETKLKQRKSALKRTSNSLGKKWKVKNWVNRKKSNKEGLSLNQYKEKLAGRPRPERCEICNEGHTKGTSGVMNFDHSHVTGKFRGWICWRCNIVLGKVKDNKELLLKLIKYLEKYE